MAKVREVLEQIGNKPLIEVLQARGLTVYDPDNDTDMTAMVSDIEDAGYTVFEPEPSYHDVADFAEREGVPVLRDDMDMETGFNLYRNRKTEEFRLWLRDLFWNGIGRIV